mmetsp:Transcript_2887/g.7935  ORF Transcript_2887/g.7935 Transcript_2887/m.7935 type:complete len:262 (+) Transcript_2887:121-906(+)|eukprot:CAMPEP_0197193052 /NCGR_PEP_ID=MMETSP1423-20130617/26323_1 /TAXON_ID=476441 /ORGANISM="Pseudo-nitzschia heimii, Strain UNC1101" /LENGTH=261 /DNA_ID=CAMNT_0042646103 /DNA_START=77 /DNA_END=862 /DNA_ORIENTATION=-
MRQPSAFLAFRRRLRWIWGLSLWMGLITFRSSVVEASCPGFQMGKTSCSTGIFSKSSLSATCPGAGDDDVEKTEEDSGKVAVTGTVTAPNDFDPDASVTFMPCIRSTGICFDSYAQDGGRVCDYLESRNGNDCGTNGRYDVYGEFDLPDDVVKDHSWSMRFVTIKVLIDHQEACTQNATTKASSEAFMASGMASLFAVGGLGLYFVRRRRKPLLVLDANQQQYYYHGDPYYHNNPVGKFVHMNDLSPGVSSIGIRGAFSMV